MDGKSPAFCAMHESKSAESFPAALRWAVRAPRKPWVPIRGHPSNACVRPMDGFTAVRTVSMGSVSISPAKIAFIDIFDNVLNNRLRVVGRGARMRRHRFHRKL